MKVLVTCPPMLDMIDTFRPTFEERGITLTTPRVVQTLTVDELKVLVPQHDGWIIGDDPATREVLDAGRRGRLRAAVKWGVGVDNVDFAACEALGIRVTNTPGQFGADVADLALSYLVALARDTFAIDRGVRAGAWPKPRGVSLGGKTLGLVGLGDIGRNLASRAMACGMRVIAWDPACGDGGSVPQGVSLETWPRRLEDAHFLVVACALTPQNRHMLDAGMLCRTQRGVRLVNVSRGPLIDEAALAEALASGQVHSAALDVFEIEPLPADSPLRRFDRCIFGTHNGSNTEESVVRASRKAIDILFGFLEAVHA